MVCDNGLHKWSRWTKNTVSLCFSDVHLLYMIYVSTVQTHVIVASLHCLKIFTNHQVQLAFFGRKTRHFALRPASPQEQCREAGVENAVSNLHLTLFMCSNQILQHVHFMFISCSFHVHFMFISCSFHAFHIHQEKWAQGICRYLWPFGIAVHMIHIWCTYDTMWHCSNMFQDSLSFW